jgi:hypothetical protein
MKFVKSVLSSICLDSQVKPIKRVVPSNLLISMINHRFYKYKTVYPSKATKEFYHDMKIDELNYVILRNVKGFNYSNYDLTNNQVLQMLDDKTLCQTIYANILDITCLDYDFSSMSLPNYCSKYFDHVNQHNVFNLYKELETMKKHYEINHKVDGYKITEGLYLIFNNPNNIIDDN